MKEGRERERDKRHDYIIEGNTKMATSTTILLQHHSNGKQNKTQTNRQTDFSLLSSFIFHHLHHLHPCSVSSMSVFYLCLCYFPDVGVNIDVNCFYVCAH